VVFQWEGRFSRVEVWESGMKILQTTDVLARSLTLTDLTLGEHRYEIRMYMGPNDPPCDPIDVLVDLEPVWPSDFGCEEQGGTVVFTWHNMEAYYDVLKIQRNGNDVPGIIYGDDSAALTGGLTPGRYTFELVAELEGYRSSGITCEVEITGPPPEFKRGDANGDGSVDVADAVFLLQYLFGGGPSALCEDSADTNDDGGLDISDAVAILVYLFGGGSIPDPGPETCGPDPTPDDLLSCEYPQGNCP